MHGPTAADIRSTLAPSETIVAPSSDGSLELRLEPTGDGVEARLATSLGTLSGPDHFVTIAPASRVTRAREADEVKRRRRGGRG